MREYWENFKVNKKPVLAPDNDMPISKQDLDAEGSGRDELGYMHRIVLRERVATWELKYARLSEDEYEYMNGLFDGNAEFDLDLKIGSKKVRTRGYCSAVGGTLSNALKGTYKNVSFKIIEC